MKYLGKIFNWFMIILTLISFIMLLLAPLYCTPTELKLITDNFAGKY